MRPRFLLMAALLLVVAWGGWWYARTATQVAQVNASLRYHAERLRSQYRTLNLHADAVYATGFPWRFDVAVEGATLSMVDGDETFAVSIPQVTLTPVDREMGRYRVNLPATAAARYEKAGSAPEHYTITPDAMPQLMLDAVETSRPCGPLTGAPCAAVAADAPFTRFALGLPASIRLHLALGAESREVSFALIPLTIALYQPIPTTLNQPLEIFVRMLREALVYRTSANVVHDKRTKIL